MARANFAAALSAVLLHEGGWANNPKDPGGATMKGVTLATYRRYRPGATKEQLRNISDEELRTIYRDGYWDEVRGDDLPSGIDFATFDFAVNSGPSRAAKFLQRVLHPLFSLSTRPDRRVMHYDHNGATLTVTPSVRGRATIFTPTS